MSMPTKKDIKRLLKKGLTGKEAAQLVIQDSWEVDNGRKGFLSDEEFSLIRDGLTPSQGAEYNKYMQTYTLITFTLKEARIKQLLILKQLELIKEITTGLMEANMIKQFWPTYMTAQQYEELQAAQRAYKLEQNISYYDAMFKRAYEMASEEQIKAADEAGESVLDTEPELAREALSYLMRAVNENDIAVYWNDEDEALLERTQELRDRLKADIGSLSDEEMEELFQGTGVPISGLYEAGLPEWVEHVDKYTPGYEDNYEAWGSGDGIAIVQEPSPFMLDDRGYFKMEELITDTFQWAMIKDGFSKDEKRPELEELVIRIVKSFKQEVKGFLAFQEVVGAASEVVSVDMTESLREWYEEIEKEVEEYKNINKPIRAKHPSGLKLPAIRLSMLKPTPSSVEYLRERIAMSLGDKWYTGEAAGKAMAEAIGTVEYPEDSDEWELELAEGESSDG